MAIPRQQMPVTAAAPAKESSLRKFIMIGGAALILLVIVVTVVIHFSSNEQGDKTASPSSDASDQVSESMELAKQSYKAMLLSGHTREQIERFEELYDAVFQDERKRLGMVEWGKIYSKVIQKLNKIILDGQITTGESKSWGKTAERELKKNGYQGGNQ
jgi:hypothetical protein